MESLRPLLLLLPCAQGFATAPSPSRHPLFDMHVVPAASVSGCLTLLNGLRRTAVLDNSADLSDYVASTWQWNGDTHDLTTLEQPTMWLVQYPEGDDAALGRMTLSEFMKSTSTLAHPLFPPSNNTQVVDGSPPYLDGSVGQLWSEAQRVASEEIEGHTWMTWTYVCKQGAEGSPVVVRVEFMNMVLDGQGATEGHRLAGVCGIEELGEVEASSQVLEVDQDQFAFGAGACE